MSSRTTLQHGNIRIEYGNVQTKLGTHLLLTTECEASHALVLDVGEDGLHRAHPATVKVPSEWCVELPSHALHGFIALAATLRWSTLWMFYDRELTLTRALGMAEALSRALYRDAPANAGSRLR